MAWAVEWGDKLEFLQDLEDSGKTPQALERRPQVHDWMREYLNAFHTLSSTRQSGFGPNPITLTEILAYLQLYGTEDKDAFIEYMLKMDASFLSAQAEKEKIRQQQQQQQKVKGAK